MHVLDQWHWVKILILNDRREIIYHKFWGKLPWSTRLKFNWYFRYRAALLQVQYPKLEVELSWGNLPVTDVNLLHKRWNDRVRAKRSKITEIKNKLNAARNTWDLIFPIEDDPFYIKCLEKLSKKEDELIEFLLEEPKITESNE